MFKTITITISLLLLSTLLSAQTKRVDSFLLEALEVKRQEIEAELDSLEALSKSKQEYYASVARLLALKEKDSTVVKAEVDSLYLETQAMVSDLSALQLTIANQKKVVKECERLQRYYLQKPTLVYQDFHSFAPKSAEKLNNALLNNRVIKEKWHIVLNNFFEKKIHLYPID